MTRVAAVLLAGLVVAGAAAAGTRPSPRGFLRWDAARRTVHLTLLAGLGDANGGFNFDGYGRGELLVVVPVGARVVVDCENRGATRHSCAIVRDSLATRPAFRGGASPSPRAGLSPGAKATFSFRASRTGSFRIACLVPGHEQARMWDVLDVKRVARPTISARSGP
jgi:Sulfocyanin (SoxE) domain